jgi:hypothetical protein
MVQKESDDAGLATQQSKDYPVFISTRIDFLLIFVLISVLACIPVILI